MRPRLIFLVGPTASGKTDVSIELAKRINAEIISCDSMQVYRGMDILTSKPSARDRRRIVHYCVGFIPPSQEYNVSQFRARALKAVKAILRKGKIPLFAGGTGLYMTVLIDGIFQVKAEDEAVRRRLYRAAERSGSAMLHKRLLRVDPDAAAKIHPNDTRRIVRALQVFEVTGKPITELQKTRRGLAVDFDVRIFCLDLDRAELYRRINDRVDMMFERGLIREVKGLLKKKPGKTASAAIGIREVSDYLAGRASLDDAKEKMKQNTRNYARRQLTWFRKDTRIEWIPVSPGDTCRGVCVKIEKRL
ncbi:MAG TPA: tRNA (adenosine(37)-N6)-dimethylallyltransferase MiaA [Candidatus Omnitrophota bacterium]|nr:tRNA (adenosine(37)-N6)-dimethylallyltransferase MiaA [Candidatus Omnitrophota bacterium]